VLTGLGLYWVTSNAPTSSLQHFLLVTVAFMLISVIIIIPFYLLCVASLMIDVRDNGYQVYYP